MTRLVIALVLLAAVGVAAADPAFIGKLAGPVTKVRDADTIEVAGVPVRLQGIAAPSSMSREAWPPRGSPVT